MAKAIKVYRQGDVMLVPIAKAPSGKIVDRENGRVILAHGEVTGHAHALVAPGVEKIAVEDKEYLRVSTQEAPLTHEEHGVVVLPNGDFEVRRQVEYFPESVRVVED